MARFILRSHLRPWGRRWTFPLVAGNGEPVLASEAAPNCSIDNSSKQISPSCCDHELVPARCHSGCTIDVAHCCACGMPAAERRGA